MVFYIGYVILPQLQASFYLIKLDSEYELLRISLEYRRNNVSKRKS
jgi:hypothetical protein